jgi:hypothetical protein
MPKGRTELYMIWKSCETFGMLPPNIKKSFDDNSVWHQALLLAYTQIRDTEHGEI